MVSRERILEAAARVYAKHGFRGATTRLIAIEAEVNEVTLFRTFGSKGALLEAVLHQHQLDRPPAELPDEPVNPEEELTEFVHSSLERVREMRPLLIQSISEVDQRPEAEAFACRGRQMVHETITSYVKRLQTRGMAAADADVDAAAVMLTGTVMSDAIARHFVPDVYPPLDEAPRRYSCCFLRSIGATLSDSVKRVIHPTFSPSQR
ncbi:MAG: TetR/AcrR family transcriptional regulator [Gemmatimonadaceae bacterium]|nr:TetR/AcrR family transcriptional regulator [Gemmatimonadaceae bacterium]